MKKNIRVIASDIDGTLALKGGQIGPKTREALEECHKRGILFGPASGRPIDEHIINMNEFWHLDFDFDFAIGMNGGELWRKETNKVEKYYLLKKEYIRDILTFLKPYDLNAIVYVDGYHEVRCLRMDDFMIESQKRNNSHVIVGGIDTLSEFDTGKIEVQLKDNDRDAIIQAIKDHKNPAWSVVQTFRGDNHSTFEFQDPRVNKGVALTHLVEAAHIPMDEVLAFGDQQNDIGLLKTAGYGVCLLNGSDETKAVADAVTEYDVTHDGVGNWLYDHLL